MHAFTTLGLREEIASALASFGFEAPTPIQALAIPEVLSNDDLYLSSATGTGKTFAYMAPIFSSIDSSLDSVQAIILAPTHDLAAQLFREAERLCKAAGTGLRIAQALGSMPLVRQLDRLATKPHILVGSAGRIRDLIAKREVDQRSCRWAVLDEGDRLFEKEVIDISTDFLGLLPDSCARILVSATIADKIVERSAPWFRNARRVFLDSTEALRTSIEHWCFHAGSRNKIEFLRRFEAAVHPERCLLFASSNASIFNIIHKLEHFGFPVAVLKSDTDGNSRRSALESFSSGEARWLLTTDLGARGLDILGVSHVISFDLPEEPSIYVHRAGRTGRAGSKGVSVALADLVELKRASKIAVRYGFPFVCKILEAGRVHDIEPENFFALAEEEEVARQNVKLEAPKASSQRRNPAQSRMGLRPRTMNEGRSSAGRSSAGSSSEGRAPDGRSFEGRSARGRQQNRSPEGRSPEGRSPEGRSPEGRSPEGRSPEGRSPEGRSPEGRPASERASAERQQHQIPERRAPSGRPQRRPSATRSPEGRAPEKRPAQGRPNQEARPVSGDEQRQAAAPQRAKAKDAQARGAARRRRPPTEKPADGNA
jgi:superfamily II DNA/RNA helicase